MGVLTVRTKFDNRWLLVLIVVGLSLIGTCLPLQWCVVNPQMIFSGQIWRLLTATWVNVTPLVLATDLIYFVFAVWCIFDTQVGDELLGNVTLWVPIIALALWVIAMTELHLDISLCGLSTLIWAWYGTGWVNYLYQPKKGLKHPYRALTALVVTGLFLATMFVPSNGYPAQLQFATNVIHTIALVIGCGFSWLWLVLKQDTAKTSK